MTMARVLLLIAATAWLMGNILLIVLAPVLFHHAPGGTPPGSHEFVTRFAAGMVFGDCLRVWSMGVTYSLLPLTLLTGVVVASGHLLAGRKGRCCLWLASLGVIVLLHLWSESIIITLNQLLPDLLSGRAASDQWGSFHQLHRESRAAVSGESAMALVLILAAAWGLLWQTKASATANER